MSPTTSSGVRLLQPMISSMSLLVLKRSMYFTGGTWSPSWYTSLAWLQQLPGTGPPMSLLWAMVAENPTHSPSKKIGVITHMSGAWGLPPR